MIKLNIGIKLGVICFKKNNIKRSKGNKTVENGDRMSYSGAEKKNNQRMFYTKIIIFKTPSRYTRSQHNIFSTKCVLSLDNGFCEYKLFFLEAQSF